MLHREYDGFSYTFCLENKRQTFLKFHFAVPQLEESDQIEGLKKKDNRGREKLDNLVLSSPNEINHAIRETPSVAVKTAETRRFCFLGNRE